MSIRVSIVVPVYNAGPYLDACVESIRRQSLPADVVQAIFVDDGSTDGSGRRADRLAATLSNASVTHTPNSGWPGRPRNIGLDEAVGEYVVFLDQDDWLGDEALERLCETADRTRADVVVGREVGHGRGVPRELFRRNVDHATLDRHPLLRLLTPHKLFRRSLLESHGIRFPEGRRRFEDHVFVLRAYFAAHRIAILADYPCYHWVARTAGDNASDQYADPHDYYRALRDVLDVVEANTEPGPRRDRMIAHWYRRRCLDRLRGARWLDAPSGHDLEVFDAIRELAAQRVGPGVDDELPLSHRLRSFAVRQETPELVTQLARAEQGARARIRVRAVDLEGQRLRIRLSATMLDAASEPMRFVRDDQGRLLWSPPATISPGAIPAELLDATADVERTTVSIVVRREDRTLEHDAVATAEPVLADREGALKLSIDARADIDLRTVAAGRALGAGRWELLVDLETCGWRSVQRLPAARQRGTRRWLGLEVVAGGDSAPTVRLTTSGATMPDGRPVRRRSGRHPIERLVPRSVLGRLPIGLRRAGKRILLRLPGARR